LSVHSLVALDPINTVMSSIVIIGTRQTVRFKSGTGTNEMETLQILYRIVQFMNLLTDGLLFASHSSSTDKSV